MEHSYLIRYGLMRQVGRFTSSLRHARGENVVIRSHRGTELGEVLTEAAAPLHDPTSSLPNPAKVLREAGPEDLRRAEYAEGERSHRFDLCEKVFREGYWPLELIDVEPLLDDRRTVLHYLGPHRLDASGLLAALRATCGLDVTLEPVGRDAPEPEVAEPASDDHSGGCGDCGSSGGGCGSGAGCNSDSSSPSAGGCSDCGVKKVIAARRASSPR